MDEAGRSQDIRQTVTVETHNNLLDLLEHKSRNRWKFSL